MISNLGKLDRSSAPSTNAFLNTCQHCCKLQLNTAQLIGRYRLAVSTVGIEVSIKYRGKKVSIHNRMRQKGFYGPDRDLNPGPPPPKGGIIPLDHRGSLPLLMITFNVSDYEYT